MPVTRIQVPFHLDDYLPDFDSPMPAATAIVAAAGADSDLWRRLAEINEAVASQVGRAQAVPVVICADCTTSLGIMAGLQRAGHDPAVVWFDAHGDVQTVETTSSGYLGGMPLRILVGYRPELIASSLGLRPVAEDRVVLVGARDLDPPEVEYLATSAIRRAAVAEVSTMELPDGPIYLHMDLDVISPSELPGVRFPAPDGPGTAEVFDAARSVWQTGRVVGVGIACTWRPGLGNGARIRPHLEGLVG